MRKVGILCIICITIFMFGYVYATNTIDLEFKVLNNKKSEKFDIYILLPKEYIIFAIKEANLDIEYEGVNTLKRNAIPKIVSQKENIQNEIYEENGNEYIQVRLEENNGIYQYPLLENYPKMDIKYRIKNIQKDYIVHIDNFKIENGTCEIEYDYTRDTVKQPDKKIVPVGVKILIALLVIILIVACIARVKGRN